MACVGEEWKIEAEPTTCEVDSWARMHLPVRRSKPEEANSSQKPPKLRRNQVGALMAFERPF